MSSELALRWETLDESLLKDIYDSDQAMYPAPDLTFACLKSWTDACPELCLSLRSKPTDSDTVAANETVHGTIIVLPLRQPFWDGLRLADISEHDIDAASMFPSSDVDSVAGGAEKVKVGLHVFHIERFPGFTQTSKHVKFAPLALEEIRSRISESFKPWNVVGYSGEKARP